MAAAREPLSAAQRRAFWAAWTGWTLDGMDSFIFALVLAPALSELLPRSGYDNAGPHVAFAGSVLFAVFLAGWGSSLLWGPLADRWGRTRTLAAAVACYALFTGAAALSQNVWQLGVFRFLAGIGIGGEWALAGTYLAEVWPESRRKMGAGYLGTGYYAGFFLAAALNYTVGAHLGWRAMFLCGGAPVLVAVYMRLKLSESERWTMVVKNTTNVNYLGGIFSADYRKRTALNAGLVTVSIVGLWAAVVYEPSAIVSLARVAGHTAKEATQLASWGTALLSLGTILGCLAVPPLAERFGRRATHALYFAGMAICIVVTFGWAFYMPDGLTIFVSSLFLLVFWRQFRHVQPLVARAVSHCHPRTCVRLRDLDRAFHRRRRQLPHRCGRGGVWRRGCAGRTDCDGIPRRPAAAAILSGDSRSGPASLKSSEKIEI